MSELLNIIKDSMMITSSNEIVEANIDNCINACKLDLRLAGINNIDEADPLTKQAVIYYTKADFNYNNLGDRFQKAYDALKISMALSGDYTEVNTDG